MIVMRFYRRVESRLSLFSNTLVLGLLSILRSSLCKNQNNKAQNRISTLVFA
jgi:hypothetical protein